MPPFVNLSADADNDYFSDGLTEEITTDLSRIHSLRVTARTSSMQHKASTKAPREIGAALGVRYLLTGSVRRAGPALRIAAQLIEATGDHQLWGDKFAGTIDEVFDLQERRRGSSPSLLTARSQSRVMSPRCVVSGCGQK
ncbi:MAG: hypothetical protein ACR2GK_04640 [Gemmatimonadaceae bacterium]